MSKMRTIAGREYAQVVRKKSFVVGLLLTPIMMIAFTVLPALLATQKSSSTEQLAILDWADDGTAEQFTEALADYRLADTTVPYYNVQGIVKVDADDLERQQFVRDSLATYINDESLRYFLKIGPNSHLIDTNLTIVTNSDNIRSLDRFERELTDIVSSRRLAESDVNLPVDSVLSLTRNLNLRTEDTRGESIPFFVKYMVGVVFFMLIFIMIQTYGVLVMRGVIEEKNSRVMEVLVSSVSPMQLLTGKLLGLGGAALTQVGLWVAIGVVIFFLQGPLNLSIDSSIATIVFNPFLIFFFVAFLCSGYVMFASLFALIGSIVNSEQEAQNLYSPLILILVMPIMIAFVVVQEPNSTLATTISLIPLFTPVMMTMRLAVLAPSVEGLSLFSGIGGEAMLGLLIVIVTGLLLVWLTARIFRIGILMYGKRPTLPELMRWVRYS